MQPEERSCVWEGGKLALMSKPSRPASSNMGNQAHQAQRAQPAACADGPSPLPTSLYKSLQAPDEANGTICCALNTQAQSVLAPWFRRQVCDGNPLRAKRLTEFCRLNAGPAEGYIVRS